MWQLPGREARLDAGALPYQRHRPERTLLYRLVDEYYPAFLEQLTLEGRSAPGYVRREFEAYLQCGRLEHGFLRVRCDTCHADSWSRSAARNAVSVPVVGRGGWPNVPRC